MATDYCGTPPPPPPNTNTLGTGFSNLPQIAYKGRLLTNNKGKTISLFSILHFPIKHRLMTFLCSMRDNWFLYNFSVYELPQGRSMADKTHASNEENHFLTFHFPFPRSPYPTSSFLFGNSACTCGPSMTKHDDFALQHAW